MRYFQTVANGVSACANAVYSGVDYVHNTIVKPAGDAVLQTAAFIFTPAAFFGVSALGNWKFEAGAYAAIATYTGINMRQEKNPSTYTLAQSFASGAGDLLLLGLLASTYGLTELIALELEPTVLQWFVTAAGVIGLAELAGTAATQRRTHRQRHYTTINDGDGDISPNTSRSNWTLCNVLSLPATLYHDLARPFHHIAGTAFALAIWWFQDLDYSSNTATALLGITAVNALPAGIIHRHKQANKALSKLPLWLKIAHVLQSSVVGFNRGQVLALIVCMFHGVNYKQDEFHTLKGLITGLSIFEGLLSAKDAAKEVHTASRSTATLPSDGVLII